MLVSLVRDHDNRQLGSKTIHFFFCCPQNKKQAKSKQIAQTQRNMASKAEQIDLDGSAESDVSGKEATLVTTTSVGINFIDKPLGDFDMLTLVEKPDSTMNRDTLAQTLDDCVGFLRAFPLLQPNTDKNNPSTIVDMVNVLTLPDASKQLEMAIGFDEQSMFVLSPQ